VGLDVAPARQISDAGMTFDLLRVERVRTGSPAEHAGFKTGDQIIAVNGRVFPTLAAFAAFMKSMAPGARANIDYIPAGGGPKNAERVALVVGKPGASGTQQGQAQEKSGMSTRTKIGCGGAGLLLPRMLLGRQRLILALAVMRMAAGPERRAGPDRTLTGFCQGSWA